MSYQKLFLQQFKEDFFHMGAVLPSSQAAAQAIVAYLARKKGPVRVLEAGAGTGAFTAEIMSHLEPGDKFDVVEINSQLVASLQQRFQQEAVFQKPGVEVQLINGDIRATTASGRYDFIIFSLPLTNFPPSLVQEILDLMLEQLKPGGIFSYIKYIFLGRIKYLFSPVIVREEIQANQKIIKGFADRYQIEQKAVLSNVPPAWVYYWQKNGDK